MTHPLADYSDYQRDLLAVVARDGPENGWELKQSFKVVRGGHVTQGYYYEQLNGLVDAGLVEKEARSGSENEFQISDGGEEALHAYADWLTER